MRTIGEVVAVYREGHPLAYARVEDWEPDRRPRWYNVRLLFLTFPPQEVVWILREEQLDGEPFTMGGVPMEIRGTPSRQTAPANTVEEPSKPPKDHKAGSVISLAQKRESKEER